LDAVSVSHSLAGVAKERLKLDAASTDKDLGDVACLRHDAHRQSGEMWKERTWMSEPLAVS
jgi:hypothetical protein